MKAAFLIFVLAAVLGYCLAINLKMEFMFAIMIGLNCTVLFSIYRSQNQENDKEKKKWWF